jgi:hypothetical protein
MRYNNTIFQGKNFYDTVLKKYYRKDGVKERYNYDNNFFKSFSILFGSVVGA